MTDFETHPIGTAKRLKELEEGACRHNCVTKREAFIAGFKAGCHANEPNDLSAYKRWKEST